MKRFFFFLALLIVSSATGATVKLPRLISDGMVLQRDIPVKIWGWADPGEKITLSIGKNKLSALTAADSTWRITLPAHKAGGDYTMLINDLSIHNITFGDVWLCSGQSNMELPIYRVMDLYKDEVSIAVNPMIRLFTVQSQYNYKTPERDIKGGEWKPVTPENTLQFSAVAYFFAQELYARYQIPIGLINASYGGSPVEAWLDEASLQAFPNHVKTLEQFKSQAFCDSIKRSDNERNRHWYGTLDKNDKGLGRWNKDDIDLNSWGRIIIPGFWNEQAVGLGNANGVVWFRKDIEVPASMTGQAAELRLGCIVDADSAFINGAYVGNVTYMYPPRIYKVPAGVLKAGQNTITVRVVNNSGQGGFVTDKAYRLTSGGDTLDLAGEWRFKLGATMPPLAPQTFFQWKPVGLYNGMIAPMENYAIKGVIWYQGESNTGNPGEYAQSFPALIQLWRNKWHNPQLPFIYVQLANFMQGSPAQPVESNWAELRNVQRNTLRLPYTGMAVTIDIGEWNDIHPLNKKDVGRRLALWAERIAYNNKKVVASGPLYHSMRIKGNKIILNFTETGSGLRPVPELKGFAIAGADGKFVWAKAIIEGNNVIVWHEEITQPVTVRYAWDNDPGYANLYNMEGLPASPFSTQE